MVLGQLDIHVKKVSLDSCLPLDTKINSRRFAELNVKGKTVKLLEENIRDQSCDLGVSKSALTGHKKANILNEKKIIN